MQAKREHRKYDNGANIWIGRYRNSQNSPHWHYDCELLTVEQGSINLMVDGVNYTIEAGQSAFIGSGQIHNMQAFSEDTVLTMIIYDCEIVKPMIGESMLTSPILKFDYNITETAAEIEKALKSCEPYFEFETSSKLRLLMIDIFRRENLGIDKSDTPPPASENYPV